MGKPAINTVTLLWAHERRSLAGRPAGEHSEASWDDGGLKSILIYSKGGRMPWILYYKSTSDFVLGSNVGFL